MTCNELEMVKRLDGRSALSNRVDDNPDSIVRRIRTFKENNAEVLAHLQSRNPVFNVRVHR